MKPQEIRTKIHLANYLRCELAYLEDLLEKKVSVIDYTNDNDDTSFSNNSREVIKFGIPKRNKTLGYRVVHSVTSDKLSSILKTFNTYLKELYLPSINVQGFVPKRNVKSNATFHLNKKYLVSVDINLFFENITIEQVSEAISSIGFLKEISTYLSEILTINGRLVQGYNTSPTIANIVAIQMDNELVKLCGEEITYTRYADDLYFSSNNIIPNLTEIEKIINKKGFTLNPSKTKIMKKGSKQFVTGLTVSDKYYPRIPKRIKRNLRLELHYIKKNGFKSHTCKVLNYRFDEMKNDPKISTEVYNHINSSKARIIGWLQYINSIEPKVARKLFGDWSQSKN